MWPPFSGASALPFALWSVTQPSFAKLVISVLSGPLSPVQPRSISAFLHLPIVGSHPDLPRAILLGQEGGWAGQGLPASMT